MKNTDWIDAKSACAALGIKPQTLYAYVSRHQIRVQSDPSDARASLYSRQDVARLGQLNRRPRARADVAQAAIRWGDPVLVTSISEVRDGTFWIRGKAIEDCAKDMTLEAVAAHLSGAAKITCPMVGPADEGRTPFSRAMKALARETDTAPPLQDLTQAEIAAQTGRMMSVVATAALQDTSGLALHRRLANTWQLDPTAADIVRQALVLLCDHELNPSTFAVRVCASTGSSLPAALLAGMATLSGPKHGGVAGLTMQALQAAAGGRFDAFLRDHNTPEPYAFGFGHPLYPQGDPRAACLLAQIPDGAPAKTVTQRLAARLSLPPNIDAALAAITWHFGLPDEAATAIFAMGRVAGWAAHAVEQAQSGEMIRPRAKFDARASALAD